MIAVSESTPGPLMINLATYVGSSQAGFLGAILATLTVVLPSFIIILLVMVALKTLIRNKYVQAVLDGLKSCIIGIILATGVYIVINSFAPIVQDTFINIYAAVITIILAAIMFGSKPILKKKISPIMLIVISAFLGIFIYGA